MVCTYVWSGKKCPFKIQAFPSFRLSSLRSPLQFLGQRRLPNLVAAAAAAAAAELFLDSRVFAATTRASRDFAGPATETTKAR